MRLGGTNIEPSEKMISVFSDYNSRISEMEDKINEIINMLERLLKHNGIANDVMDEEKELTLSDLSF